ALAVHRLGDTPGDRAIGRDPDDEGAFAGEKSHGFIPPGGIMPEGAPPPLRSGLVVRVQVDAELLSGVEPRMGREAVPRHDLRHAALKEPRELGPGVAL